MGEQVASALLFINYGNGDDDFALRLYDDLASYGQSVWIDRRDIQRGQDWSTAVNQALHKATHMLLIWSDQADTREVRAEWSHFLDAQKPIIILRRDNHPLHYELQRLPVVDFASDYEGAVRKLVSYLTTPKQDPKAARTALEQGNAAYRSHDFTNAIKAYNRAIALDPTNAEAHFSRAMAFLRLGHTERALRGSARQSASIPGWRRRITIRGKSCARRASTPARSTASPRRSNAIRRTPRRTTIAG